MSVPMTSTAESDRQITEFVMAQHAALVRWAYLLTGDRNEAQDLTQAALERLCTRWPRIRNKHAPSAYVRRTIVSLVLNDRRRRRSAGHAMTMLGGLAVPSASDPGFTSVDDRLGLAAGLKTLTQAQRVALTLRYYDDLSIHDAAILMRCSESAVKTHSARGIAPLRDAGITDNPARSQP